MGEAQAANNLADAYHWLGRTDEALDLYRRALELNRAGGRSASAKASPWCNLGWMLVDLDRAEEAIDYLLQAQDAFAEIDYADGVGYALHILGRCYLSLGRDAEALSCLRRGAGQPPGHGQPAQAGGDPDDRSAPRRAGSAWRPRRANPGLRRRPSSTELGDSAEAEEVRAEQAESGIS